MSINENNYEEYFLLYADKELSAAEKNMVEEFVQQHPGLEEEFLMLQQSVIKPDNIKLKDEKFLIKEEALRQAQYISENNYEEKFILYSDNELTSSEKDEIENFTNQNSSLQNEFALLRQIKYQPDASVIYPDKKSLLRKEEDVKVIPMIWLKALAAAVLLGFGLWIGIAYLQTNNGVKNLVQAIPVKHPSEFIDTAKEKKDADNISSSEKAAPALPLVAAKNMAKPRQKLQSPLKENLVVNNPGKQIKNDNQKISDPLPLENNAVAGIEPPKKIDPVLKTKTAESPVDIASAKIESVQNPTQPNSLAQAASYKPAEAQKSDNYVFYNITDEQFNKSKVGVLFKKIKGVFDKKNSLKEKVFKLENKVDNSIN